jgi:hypothetical protein
MRDVMAATTGLVLVASLASVSCGDSGCPDPNGLCGETSTCPQPDVRPIVDAGPDAGPDAADSRVDASLEFGFDRDAYLAPRSACDATEIQLPPTGNTMVTPPGVWNGTVSYADERFGGDYGVDVFLYDLVSCTEFAVTKQLWFQLANSIFGGDLIFQSRGQNTCISDMFDFDIRTGSFRQLPTPSDGAPELFNGRNIIFWSWSELDCIFDQSLVVWDLFTEHVTTLADPDQGAEGISISPTHAAWVAYGGPGKDVFFVDLATYDIAHVESTFDPEVWWTATWGDWVLWEDLRNGKSDIYGLRISTGEELRLTDNDSYNGMPTLRGNLACYRTTEWNNTGWDLAVMDLETGVTRRVTRTPDSGYKCGPVDSGWLVYQRQKWAQYWANEIWAVDLVAAGILDEAGEHVLP